MDSYPYPYLIMLPASALALQEHLDAHEVTSEWDPYRAERTRDIIQIVLEHVEGDVLEIGAYEGKTTKIFCEVGAEYDRHVFVIDPWDDRQNGYQHIFENFIKKTARYKNLTVHRMGSENPKAVKSFLKEGVRFAFILIDGLHSYDAVSNDLRTYKDLLEPYGIICVDDWRGPYPFCGDIRQAATDHLDDNYRALHIPESFIENYFVKLA